MLLISFDERLDAHATPTPAACPPGALLELVANGQDHDLDAQPLSIQAHIQRMREEELEDFNSRPAHIQAGLGEVGCLPMTDQPAPNMVA